MCKSHKIVHPQDGGCWFCSTADGDMLFDTEFDTYVHEQCLRNTLAGDPEHLEARLMAYLVPDVVLPALEEPDFDAIIGSYEFNPSPSPALPQHIKSLNVRVLKPFGFHDTHEVGEIVDIPLEYVNKLIVDGLAEIVVNNDGANMAMDLPRAPFPAPPLTVDAIPAPEEEDDFLVE